MKTAEHYTFGDSDVAAERLRLLARVFEPNELAALGAEPAQIASGAVSAAPVSCGLGQVVLRRC